MNTPFFLHHKKKSPKNCISVSVIETKLACTLVVYPWMKSCYLHAPMGYCLHIKSHYFNTCNANSKRFPMALLRFLTMLFLIFLRIGRVLYLKSKTHVKTQKQVSWDTILHITLYLKICVFVSFKNYVNVNYLQKLKVITHNFNCMPMYLDLKWLSLQIWC
mgnify:CR=1 FL=1